QRRLYLLEEQPPGPQGCSGRHRRRPFRTGGRCMSLNPVTHPLLHKAGVRHGFFTREGGVSEGIYAGLNTGVGSKDDPARVAENRRRVVEWMGGAADDLCGCYQVHSAVARVAESGWGGERPEGD